MTIRNKYFIVGVMFSSLFLSSGEVFCGDMASVTVMHCNDGDTCRVKTDEGLWFNVRLFGIDAQEMSWKRGKRPGQPFAEPAKGALNKKTKGKLVKLKQSDLGRYNRPIVEIWLKDKNINLEMVEEGWAEAYRGKTKRIKMAPYFEAEKKAQKRKLGIWKLKNYQSPAEFRKRKKTWPK